MLQSLCRLVYLLDELTSYATFKRKNIDFQLPYIPDKEDYITATHPCAGIHVHIQKNIYFVCRNNKLSYSQLDCHFLLKIRKNDNERLPPSVITTKKDSMLCGQNEWCCKHCFNSIQMYFLMVFFSVFLSAIFPFLYQCIHQVDPQIRE